MYDRKTRKFSKAVKLKYGLQPHEFDKQYNINKFGLEFISGMVLNYHNKYSKLFVKPWSAKQKFLGLILIRKTQILRLEFIDEHEVLDLRKKNESSKKEMEVICRSRMIVFDEVNYPSPN